MSARLWLDAAARAAYRAVGDVEPNPVVGAVVVRDGRVIGLGHHRRFGGLHAEREALADCRRRGEDPRGATVYVTLEPCCHHGKQPPCTEALIEAGVARVVYARRDPGEASGGGAEVLRRARIECELSDESVLATRLSDPFVKRVTTGLPWVVAKWAQTADGRLVTGPGEGRWISGEAARHRVHRLRARVDAIVTGIGTVLADDPALDARGVRRVRRVATRVVLDPMGQMPRECRLLTAPGPVVVVRAGEAELALGACGGGGSTGGRAASGTGEDGGDEGIGSESRSTRGTGGRDGGVVETVEVSGDGERLDLEAVVRMLADRYGATNVMLECGPRLLAAFASGGLIDEAMVYVAPGGGGGIAGVPGAWVRGMECVRRKAVGGDVEWWMRRRFKDERG